MNLSIKYLLNDALPIVTKFAPNIGAAIGGPVGAATGIVVPLLANAFGVHPSDIGGLAKKILTDTEAKGKLESVEAEHGDWVNGLMDSIGNLASAKVNIELTWQPVTPTTRIY